jgi:small subunit ribosomal protein S20
MPIIASAKKQMKQNNVRKERLKPYKTKMLTLYKNITKLVSKEDKDGALNLISEAVSTVDLAVKKNIIHKNNGSRKKSKMYKLINSLAKGEKVPAVKKNKTDKKVKEQIKKETNSPKKTASTKKTTSKKVKEEKASK